MKPPKLLIIEDDPGIQSVLRSLGPELGLEVECVSEGQLGIGLAEQQEFCAAILDLGLPDLGGIAVLKRLRELHPALPILLLTSRSTKIDKVLGLELGADDYLTKPFDFQELVARLRGVLRRKAAYQKASDLPVNSESNQSTIRFDELEVNFFERTVRRNSQPLDLSVLEFDILAYLIQHRGRVVSRDELLTKVWGYAPNVATNFDATVTTNLSRLRAKIEPNPEKPRFLLTVRGVGYRFLEHDRNEEIADS